MNPQAQEISDLEKLIASQQKQRYCSKGAWFRGHRKGTWKLQPRLLREPHGILREATLSAEVQLRGSHFLTSVSGSWERLALMQHHGIPTRLLDWTEDMWVALFFAMLPPVEKPKLWIMNPFLISSKATGKKVIWGFDDSVHNYDKFVENWDSWPFELPVPIYSPWKHGRHVNQKAFYTVHGRNGLCLSELCPRFVGSVDIPDSMHDVVRAELLKRGFNPYYIFQDFDSFGDFLRNKYRLP